MADSIFKFLHLFLVEIPSAIAWPVILLFLGVSHRVQLRSFLDRMIKIGPSGAEAIPPQQSPDPQPPLPKPDNSPTIAPTSDSDPVLAQIEQNIRRQLKESGQDNLTPEEQKKLFIAEYAKLVLTNHFDKIRLSIFGTQITALRFLSDGVIRPKIELLPFYAQHIEKVNNRNLTDKGNRNLGKIFGWPIPDYPAGRRRSLPDHHDGA
jgi:hypothetical protein